MKAGLQETEETPSGHGAREGAEGLGSRTASKSCAFPKNLSILYWLFLIYKNNNIPDSIIMLENEVSCKRPHLQPLNFTTPGNAASSTGILWGHTQAKFKLKCKDSIFSFSVKSMRLHTKAIAMAIVGGFRQFRAEHMEFPPSCFKLPSPGCVGFQCCL